jgi:ADP-heptose:LPS heptosyltransferase
MLLRNVLIFHAAALGDFVLTWPLGLALGRLYPQSRVMYISQKQKGLLAEKILNLESCDMEMGWHHLFGDADRLPDDCRRKLAGAHSIFSFAATPDETWMQNVQHFATGADIVSIAPRPPADSTVHATMSLMESLSERPVVQGVVRQILAAIFDQGVGRLRQADHSEPGPAEVLIHPGSGSREKCWPLDRFVELAEQFRKDGRRCRFIFGEAEQERWSPADIRKIESIAPAAFLKTYVDLARELSRADLYIGNDSGPSHLAGILGIRSIVLFGPTNPTVWHPLGPRVTVLRKPNLIDLNVDEVYSACRSQIESKRIEPPKRQGAKVESRQEMPAGLS